MPEQLKLETLSGSEWAHNEGLAIHPPQDRPRIIYSRGFPFGAPLVMIRGGATKLPAVREFLKSEGFAWGGRYAWEHYLDRRDFGPILKKLRDEYGCNVIPKSGMDDSYLIDLDDPQFGRPDRKEQ